MFFSTPTLLATISALLLTTAAPLQKRSYSGRATYYAVGLGSCGQNNVASDYIVALNSAQYGSGYPGPQCGKQIWISYGGQTTTATIMDECPGCGYGDLDLSQGLFEHFASTSVGVFQMTWDFVDNSTPATSTTPTTTWQAPTSTSTTPTSTYTPPTTTSDPPTSTSTSQTPPTTTSTSTTSSSTSTSSTAGPAASQSLFASASPSATPSSTSSNGGNVPTLSNIETLSQVLVNLGQLVVVGSS